MSPIPRVRTRSFPNFQGGYYPAGSPGDLVITDVLTGEERCEDTHGSKETANYFDLQRWKLSPGHMTGIESVWPVYGFEKMPYLNQPTPDFLPGADSVFLDPNAALTRVAAWSSPGRASVSLPNFLFELRELPEMVFRKKPTGKRRRGETPNTGNTVAELNFGWAAAYSDILKLFDFAAQLEKRIKELNAIYDRPGGLKRQRVVAESHISSESIVAANSWICGVQVRRTNVCVSRQWAALSWVPLFGALGEKPSAASIIAKAKGDIHGWRANPKLVWDALPWSWLIDYFANVGDLLEATSNSFEYRPINCCTMNQVTSNISDVVTLKSDDFVVTPARMEVVWKHRQPSSFGFSLLNPLLSGRQLVTLAGIAANWR